MFYKSINLAYACIIHFVVGNELNSLISILPSHPIYASEGDKLQVQCIVNKRISTQNLYWKAVGRVKGQIRQKWLDGHTVQMVFPSIHPSDAGVYQCIYNASKEQHSRGVFIKVFLKRKSKDEVCKTSEFLCPKSQMCIPLALRCDSFQDCFESEDEQCEYVKGKPSIPMGCRLGQFRCQNGDCIDNSLQCDSFHHNDCGDWSDEYCLLAQEPVFGASNYNNTTEIVGKSDEEDAAHLTWLRTTVYAVIGCTVSVVLTISLIVIAVFRVRMKQSVYRHTERALRRRNISNRNRYSARLSENDPFLNYAPGNIIVNVNNGVQFIPGNEFTSLVGRPPSYSDIDNDGCRQRESPPPSYSTIDRNPFRGPINFDDYIIQQSSLTTACATCLPTLSRDSSIISDSESYIQFQLGPMPQTQNASVQTSNTGATNSPQHISRAFTDTPPPVRQPVLTVQQGQIVLSGYAVESQNISVSENSSQVSPAHLRVERGRIILANDPTSIPPDIHCDNTVQENEGSQRKEGTEESTPYIEAEGGSIILRNTCNSTPILNFQTNLEKNESQTLSFSTPDVEGTATAAFPDETSHGSDVEKGAFQNSNSTVGHKTDHSDNDFRKNVDPDNYTSLGETETNQSKHNIQTSTCANHCDYELSNMIGQIDSDVSGQGVTGEGTIGQLGSDVNGQGVTDAGAMGKMDNDDNKQGVTGAETIDKMDNDKQGVSGVAPIGQMSNDVNEKVVTGAGMIDQTDSDVNEKVVTGAGTIDQTDSDVNEKVVTGAGTIDQTDSDVNEKVNYWCRDDRSDRQ